MSLVSILLPFRNAASTIAECLDSIQEQTYSNWELVAIDDGSEDNSAALIAERASDDPRIHLIRPGRIGLVGALNLGLRETRSDLIARMDADDVMLPERLALQRSYLLSNPDVALVATRVEIFPEQSLQAGYREYIRWQNGCITPEEIAANIYVESPLAHPSVMMRRHALESLGGYADGPFPEDYDLWLRMHEAGLRMAKLPRVLLRWREGDGRASRVDPRYSREAFDLVRARYLGRDERLHSGRAIAFWGAGRKTRGRARLLMDEGITPSVWIDIDPRKIGNVVWDIPVVAPDWLERSPRPFVLAYVANHGARDLIAAALATYGYRPGEDWLAVG